MKRISFGKVFAGVLVGSFAGMLHVGCGSPGKVGNTGGEGGGGSGGVVIDLTSQGGVGGAGVGGEGGTSGASGSSGSPEGTCGDTTITPNRAPVDILVVLDRSGSMAYSISDDCYCTGQNPRCSNTAGCTDRWTAVKGALDQTVNANASINWGLEFYSSPNGADCSVSLAPQVAIGANSGPTILNQMGTVTPANHTPTAAAINAATMYMQSVVDGNSRAILLATDGMPNCVGGRVNSDDDMPATTAAVAGAAAAGFPVYVVGMGPQASITNLNQLAVAGGTGSYYPADSAQSLSDSLATISKIVSTTCEFQTPMVPPDPTKVYVYVNKVFVEQSADNGWVCGDPTCSDILLTGTYCADMLGGNPSTVQIIFGCKDYIPPGVIP